MNILLVDDHTATREEVVSLITREDDLYVVAQASNGEEGIRLARELHPDVIVMDVAMPDINGIAATQAIRSTNPDACILASSNLTGTHLVDLLLRSGAMGYVRKDRSYEELIPAIRAVAKGQQYVSEGVNE